MEDKKKIILTKEGEIPEEFKEFLLKARVEVKSLESIGDDQPYWASISSEKDGKKIVFNKEENWKKLVSENQLRAMIYPEIHYFDVPAQFIKRFFEADSSLNPEVALQGVLLKNFTVKITDPSSIGYISDLICDVAQKEGFNFVSVRTYLTGMVSYLSYLLQEEQVELPFEVDYGLNQDGFYVQMYCSAQSISIENITEALGEENVNNPYHGILETCFKNVDLIECFKLESNEKICFTSVWIKNASFDRDNFYPTILIHNIESFNFNTSTTGGRSVETKINLIKSEKEIRENNSLPGMGPSKFSPRKFDDADNLVLIKRVTDFVFTEQNRKLALGQDLEDPFTLEVLESYIQTFPDQESLGKLTVEDKKLIVEAVNNSLVKKELEESVEVVKDTIEEDDYLNNLVKSLEDMSAKEARLVIGGSIDEEEFEELVTGELSQDDDFMKVGAWEEEEDNSKTVVSGGEEEEDDVNIVGGGDEEEELKRKVGGTTQHFKDGVWEVKKSSVVDKVKGKINDLRGQGKSHQEIDKEVQLILKDELKINEKQSNKMAQALSDEASEDIVKEKLSENADAIKARLENQKLQSQVVTRDQQISKMKKLIDKMKTEIQITREGAELNPTINETSSTSTTLEDNVANAIKEENAKLTEDGEVLKKDLLKSQMEAKAQEATSNREKEKLENQIAEMEKERDIWKRKVEDAAKEKLTEDGIDVSQIQKDNEQLEGQVKDLKNRISFLLKNNKANRETKVSMDDIDRLQKKLDDSEKEVKLLLKEKDGFLNDIETLNRKININDQNSKAGNQQAGNANLEFQKELDTKSKLIDDLNKEKREYADNAKAMTLKVKSLEQKIKFMTAQIEGAAKKRPGTMGGGSGAAIDQKTVQKLKQSEKMTQKFQMVAKKAQDELSEKKTELHKTKLENKTLSLKVKDLEKKLANLIRKNAA